jgi:hypothetical protein
MTPPDTAAITATPASKTGAVLTPEQTHSWRERGFAFVSGVFEEDLVARLRADARAKFPAPGSPEVEQLRDFGGGLVFPSASDAFNAVTLHPRLLDAVAQLLKARVVELRLTQSDLWPKYGQVREPGALDNDEQRIHVDYPNHTLAHPSPWDRPEAVELILYLDRVEDCGGATALVARDSRDDPAYRGPLVDSPGIGDLDWINDREHAEAYLARVRPQAAAFRASLYARERRVHFAPGDVLFYRHDLWHRGTRLRPGSLRLAHNITYRLAKAEWISVLHAGWAWSAYSPAKRLERLIAQASLDQRAVLGFPQPGSDYWCEETLAAVQARYGVYGMDVTPYRR